MRGSHTGAIPAAAIMPGSLTMPATTVVPRLSGRAVIGFDVTEFLDTSYARAHHPVPVSSGPATARWPPARLLDG